MSSKPAALFSVVFAASVWVSAAPTPAPANSIGARVLLDPGPVRSTNRLSTPARRPIAATGLRFTPDGASKLNPSVPGLAQELASALKPGIYQSSPYSCLVIVPEAHLDDRILLAPPPVQSNMPVIKPKLQLAPAPGR